MTKERHHGAKKGVRLSAGTPGSLPRVPARRHHAAHLPRSAKKFAVGGLTAAAIFESLRPNYAWAEQVKKDDARIKVSYETVASPEGNGSIKGYFARPANATGKLPAVLVIHENRGLNPYIEDVARRFAVANFIAYAPDGLTSVGGFPGNDEEGRGASSDR